MPDPISPPSAAPAAPAPDGNRDMILSGVWVAKPFVSIDAFPESLVLTAADRKLARSLAEPLCLCRRKVGPHTVELLIARGEDRSVGLSLRIPTAANQFKDPYLLMEAEPGNTREVGVREFQFHLQGRLTGPDLAAADWTDYFAAAARKLDALRSKKVATARKPARRAAKARKPSRPGRRAAAKRSAKGARRRRR